MASILLIDNFDSFVFNLERYLQELGCNTAVARNDAITIDEIRWLQPDAIVISPGPCTPNEAGISLELIRQLGPSVPMLGVCLGHQAMTAALGGRVIRAPEPVHGQTSPIWHHGQNIFRDLPQPFMATRYHSLIAEEATLPVELRIVARTEEGVPMALEHRDWPMYGVQFHPESILTQHGHRLLNNFLALAGIAPGAMPAGDWSETRITESPADARIDGQPLHW